VDLVPVAAGDGDYLGDQAGAGVGTEGIPHGVQLMARSVRIAGGRER
jgi:hypothetical protein